MGQNWSWTESIEAPQAMACACIAPVTLEAVSLLSSGLAGGNLAYHIVRATLVMLDTIFTTAVLAFSFDFNLAAHTLSSRR